MKVTRVIDDETDVADNTESTDFDEETDPDNFPPIEQPETEVHCSMTYGDIVISVVTVTRELALYWVRRHNTRNRKLRPSRRNSYARDMAAGDWMFNGDSICLDEEGTIIDGQHRLEAIIESRVEQQMLIVEYLPIEVQVTKDIGGMRTMADQLAFKGFANPTTLAAIARRLCYVKRPDGVTYGGAWTPTRAEMRRFVVDNEGLVERAVDVALRASAAKLPAAPSVIGSAYFLAAEQDKYSAELFFVDRLIDNVGMQIGEPVHVLQRRLQRHMHDFKTPMDPEMVFRYCIHAWNHWREGKAVLSKLQRPKNGWPPYSEMVVR